MCIYIFLTSRLVCCVKDHIRILYTVELSEQPKLRVQPQNNLAISMLVRVVGLSCRTASRPGQAVHFSMSSEKLWPPAVPSFQLHYVFSCFPARTIGEMWHQIIFSSEFTVWFSLNLEPVQKVGGGIAHHTVTQALSFMGNQLPQLQHWHSRTQQSWSWWSCDHKTVSCLILSQGRKTNEVQQKTFQSPIHIYVTPATLS